MLARIAATLGPLGSEFSAWGGGPHVAGMRRPGSAYESCPRPVLVQFTQVTIYHLAQKKKLRLTAVQQAKETGGQTWHHICDTIVTKKGTNLNLEGFLVSQTKKSPSLLLLILLLALWLQWHF